MKQFYYNFLETVLLSVLYCMSYNNCAGKFFLFNRVSWIFQLFKSFNFCNTNKKTDQIWVKKQLFKCNPIQVRILRFLLFFSLTRVLPSKVKSSFIKESFSSSSAKKGFYEQLEYVSPFVKKLRKSLILSLSLFLCLCLLHLSNDWERPLSKSEALYNKSWENIFPVFLSFFSFLSTFYQKQSSWTKARHGLNR
jgi:hypothetical protein